MLRCLIATYLLLGWISSIDGQSDPFCTLLWHDEFQGSNLDPRKWSIEQTCSGSGNDELECYTSRPQNVHISNGSLILRAIPETYTGSRDGCSDGAGCTRTQPFTSGRIHSTYSWLYGRIEVSAKLTQGSHLWPAIWLLPSNWCYGGWAASGEIDIMEQRGDTPSYVSGTLHHGAVWPNNVWDSTGDHSIGENLADAYHTYALEWTPTEMRWFLDAHRFQTYNLTRWWNSTQNNPYTAMGQPWDKKFHLVLNVAVGGNFFGGYPSLTQSDVQAWVKSDMTIDWVRIWTTGGNCSLIDDPEDLIPIDDGGDSDNTSSDREPWYSISSPYMWGILGGGGFILIMLCAICIVFGTSRRRSRSILQHQNSESSDESYPYLPQYSTQESGSSSRVEEDSTTSVEFETLAVKDIESRTSVPAEAESQEPIQADPELTSD